MKHIVWNAVAGFLAATVMLFSPLQAQAKAEPPTIATICVENNSTTATDAEVSHVGAVVQYQIDHDFAPAWGFRAQLVWGCTNATQWAVHVVDKLPMPVFGIGVHGPSDASHGHSEAPWAYVSTIQRMGVRWSSTFSHEVLEMLVDPYDTMYSHYGRYYLEVCDPVEDYYYKLGDVQVQDFVLPAWMQDGSKGPWDYMQVLTAPWEGHDPFRNRVGGDER